MFLKLLVPNIGLALAAALPSSNHVVHEKRSEQIQSWVKRDAVPADAILPMRIGLTQSNLHKGYDLLMDVSQHDSPNYGKYYTAEQVTELFAPAPDTVDAVRTWLEKAGVSPKRVSQSSNKAWLQFDAPTEEAEALLKTKFHLFEHITTGDANIACDEYSLPHDIIQHVDYVTPGVKLASTGGNAIKTKAKREALKKRGMKNASNKTRPAPGIRKPLPSGYPIGPVVNVVNSGRDLSSCKDLTTPACLRALYQIPKGNLSNPNNKLGIYETDESYIQKDLDDFFNIIYPDIPRGTGPDDYSVDGGIAPSYVDEGEDEPTLDIQVAYPLIWPQGIQYYQVDDLIWSNEAYFPANGLFNTFLDALDGSYCSYSYDGETGDNPLYDPAYPDTEPSDYAYKGQLQCGVYEPPSVISISWAANEADYTVAYQQRQCQEWLKLGLQGTSVLLASGDSGVGGIDGPPNHPGGCLGDEGQIFNPAYPATCPYLTTVGATGLKPGADVAPGNEIAATTFSSGGGFSNVYLAPSYQKQAIDDYFTRYAPESVKEYPFYDSVNNQSFGAGGGVYNRAGRGFPDVSAFGDNFFVIINSYPSTLSGTSASTPTFASIITRINDERLAVGKSTVGFLNPVLYAHPEVFHDVTKGSNPGCTGVGSAGFAASKGWDPVTGLGSPSWPKMLKLFMGLQ